MSTSSTSQKKKSTQEVLQDKSTSLMNLIAWRCSYDRENPQRFVKDYLGIQLRLFQKILIYAMMHNNFFLFIASRGLGKTFLVSLYCCVKAILFPKSKIVIASSVRSQGNECLLKIQDELMPMSNNLKYENEMLDIWRKKYKTIFLNADYSNCNYQKIDRSKDIEVLIINY